MTEHLSTVFSGAVTEAQTVKETVIEGIEPFVLDLDEVYSVVVPAGASRQVLDLERYQPTPYRKHGSVELHTQESFTRFVNEHKVEATHIYADRDSFRFVAAFNDATATESGWADHRASLTLKHTPEWLHWTKLDDQLVGQVAFAEHIEDGLLEIHDPDGAYILELAQTFHAHTNITFRQAHTLASGERQFEYVENTTAGAGRAQDLTIPKELILGIAPFEGTQPYKVVARLRYRLADGNLNLGYKLDRPHEVLRSAFEDTVGWIGTDTALTVLLGKPPVI